MNKEINNRTMKTHSKVLFMALAALVLLAGCKKQSSEKRITKFAFRFLVFEENYSTILAWFKKFLYF